MENKHTRSVSLIDGHIEDKTDNEIIKALECCKAGNCDECPFYGVKEDCEVELPEEALDLINRQQAEIKQLETIERFATKTIEKQTAEIERLNGLLIENEKAFNKMTELYNKAFNRCKTAKSEAIKEFAERLTDRICEHIEQSLDNPNGNNYFITDVYTDINNLVKEMTEVSENVC